MGAVMSASPRVVAADITFMWDGVPWRLQRGQVIDVAPGSALEQAIGADLLPPLGAVAAQPPAPVSEVAEEEPQAAEPSQAAEAPEPEEQGTQDEAPPRPRSAAKDAAAPAEDSGEDAGGGEAM